MVQSRPDRLQYRLNFLFENTEFRNAKVLDIGGGNGFHSLYAAFKGARKVVCLEPGAAGSSNHGLEKAHRACARLNLSNRLVIEQATIQAFDNLEDRYDVILSHNSINHLDESACIHLMEDESARNIYRELFNKFYALSEQSAKLIVHDCSRYNFFAAIGVKNPLATSIEWHKHQAPQVWASLLEEAGFSEPKIRWYPHHLKFRRLTGSRFAAYFMSSLFCLTMKKN